MSATFEGYREYYETFLKELTAMVELAELPYRDLDFYPDTKKFNEHFQLAVEFGRIFDKELFQLPESSSVDENNSTT